jgi:dsRNA-specific ribonuclease
MYVIQVIIDGTEYGQAVDFSIKGAEQLAAEKTWHQMVEESQDI